MMVSGMGRLKRKVRRMQRNLQSNVSDSVERSLGDTKRTAQNRIENQHAVASRQLWSSFQQKSFRRGTTHTHTLENVAPHAQLVEFGTGGFFRPNEYVSYFKAPSMGGQFVREIKRWLIVKPTFALPPSQTATEAAVAIAEAIAHGTDTRPPGTPAQPFFFDAWAVNRPILEERAEYAVSRTVRRA